VNETAVQLANIGRRLGNELYKFAFPIYRPLYGIFKSYADRTERELLRRYVSAGSVVVDAGANIGIYSEFLAKSVGSSGVVHSFEPEANNFARLRAALSDFPNVRLNQLALSNRTGESTLYVSDHLNVDHRAYPTGNQGRRRVAIQSTTLDDYFPPRERVDLIKMDLQGFELHALRGARRVLDENRNIKLLVEFWPYGLREAGGDWRDLVMLLEDQGMRLQQVSYGKVTPLDAAAVSENPDWYLNLLAGRA
jgi:FkbM family methyltransferase